MWLKYFVRAQIDYSGEAELVRVVSFSIRPCLTPTGHPSSRAVNITSCLQTKFLCFQDYSRVSGGRHYSSKGFVDGAQQLGIGILQCLE